MLFHNLHHRMITLSQRVAGLLVLNSLTRAVFRQVLREIFKQGKYSKVET